MRYSFLIAFLLFFSCGKQEDILLPKSNVTIVSDVEDHSPVYIFFRTGGKDTLAEVNRKNSIISTNWIFNIDKRLPLRLVIPEVMKLQAKKRDGGIHKNEAAENYYSYADSIGKNLAFLPFTKVYYKLEKPKSGQMICFDKSGKISIDDKKIHREELQKYLDNLPSGKPNKILFCFDKNSSYGSYIQNKVFIHSAGMGNMDSEEFIY